MTQQQGAYEATRIEFERMGAELSRVLEKLEKSEAEKESLRANSNMNDKRNVHVNQQNMIKLEADAKQMIVERDQLVLQLEKSQEILMNFQKELNAAEGEVQRLRQENQRFLFLFQANDQFLTIFIYTG